MAGAKSAVGAVAKVLMWKSGEGAAHAGSGEGSPRIGVAVYTNAVYDAASIAGESVSGNAVQQQRYSSSDGEDAPAEGATLAAVARRLARLEQRMLGGGGAQGSDVDKGTPQQQAEQQQAEEQAEEQAEQQRQQQQQQTEQQQQQHAEQQQRRQDQDQDQGQEEEAQPQQPAAAGVPALLPLAAATAGINGAALMQRISTLAAHMEQRARMPVHAASGGSGGVSGGGASDSGGNTTASSGGGGGEAAPALPVRGDAAAPKTPAQHPRPAVGAGGAPPSPARRPSRAAASGYAAAAAAAAGAAATTAAARRASNPAAASPPAAGRPPKPRPSLGTHQASIQALAANQLALTRRVEAAGAGQRELAGALRGVDGACGETARAIVDVGCAVAGLMARVAALECGRACSSNEGSCAGAGGSGEQSRALPQAPPAHRSPSVPRRTGAPGGSPGRGAGACKQRSAAARTLRRLNWRASALELAAAQGLGGGGGQAALMARVDAMVAQRVAAGLAGVQAEAALSRQQEQQAAGAAAEDHAAALAALRSDVAALQEALLDVRWDVAASARGAPAAANAAAAGAAGGQLGALRGEVLDAVGALRAVVEAVQEQQAKQQGMAAETPRQHASAQETAAACAPSTLHAAGGGPRGDPFSVLATMTAARVSDPGALAACSRSGGAAAASSHPDAGPVPAACAGPAALLAMPASRAELATLVASHAALAADVAALAHQAGALAAAAERQRRRPPPPPADAAGGGGHAGAVEGLSAELAALEGELAPEAVAELRAAVERLEGFVGAVIDAQHTQRRLLDAVMRSVAGGG